VSFGPGGMAGVMVGGGNGCSGSGRGRDRS
jgi:hypothetical protein